MAWLIDGIQIGLILCCLIGPIFFALIQAGVEEGLRAGTMVGLGIWISDVLFIAAVYFGLAYVTRLISGENFSLYLGIGGSIILMVFGLSAYFSKPPSIDLEMGRPMRSSSYWSLWLKGFLINTVNPFTVIFWLGLMTTTVIDGNLSTYETQMFFGGILGTIVLTDFLNVVLAKWIRRVMQPKHVLWLRRISGVALIIFGVVLLVRVGIVPGF